MNKRRNCVIPNYIPYKRTKKVKYSKWLDEYFEHLDYMCYITENIIRSKYPDYKMNFEDFCSLIYMNSSKYIKDENNYH